MFEPLFSLLIFLPFSALAAARLALCARDRRAPLVRGLRPVCLRWSNGFRWKLKSFSFSANSGKSALHLEEKRKGFSGFISLGIQCSN